MSGNEEKYNDADYVAPLGLARLALSWIGAIASITLIVGLTYWVFQLGTRNPNEIPIILAMEGPARSQPENPGGTQANHQGLAVNAVQSDGTAEKTAETVVLAPQQPALTAEDLAQDMLAKMQPVLRPATVKPEPKTSSQQDLEEAIITAVAEAPKPTVQDPTLETESIVIETQSIVISSSKNAPLNSPIPIRRPSDLIIRIKSATAVSSQPNAGTTSVPVGTRLVQLGAYDSAEIAKKEWGNLIRKHGDLLEGKQQLVQVAASGGRKFYRLRAIGFETAEDSQNLCAALLARGTACIPVTAR
jgi:hypothetical protein